MRACTATCAIYCSHVQAEKVGEENEIAPVRPRGLSGDPECCPGCLLRPKVSKASEKSSFASSNGGGGTDIGNVNGNTRPQSLSTFSRCWVIPATIS